MHEETSGGRKGGCKSGGSREDNKWNDGQTVFLFLRGGWQFYSNGYGILDSPRERSMYETPANLYVNGPKYKEKGTAETQQSLPGGLLEDT